MNEVVDLLHQMGADIRRLRIDQLVKTGLENRTNHMEVVFDVVHCNTGNVIVLFVFLGMFLM